ncbi:MAG TPA: endonuclease/exonuclease/phosphatase family protein [Mesorhizobium sp.]|jgi:predicted extracellular nuclease|nr:endonuclease/exonuclease/phosphatase family protein [Mesorhizobium sp.]
MPVRLATFNVENLLRRFDFSGFHDRGGQDRAIALFDIDKGEEFRALERARAVAQSDDARQQTALSIAAADADILCLQEVESEEALAAFEHGYLFRMLGASYRGRHVSRGNDPRGIDVGLMFRERTAGGEPIELVTTRSHAPRSFTELGVLTPELEERGFHARDRVFRRDCLEADFRVGERSLTLFVVHLKSMGGGRDGVSGREASMPLRTAEAKAVRRIVERRFPNGDGAWAICGDLNDYRERLVVGGGVLDDFTFTPMREEGSSLDVFLSDGFAVDPVARRPEDDRWTLFHARGPQERHLCQLDYLLLSPQLAAANAAAIPTIVRAGQPWRTPFPPGQEVRRFPRLGWDRPKASDHCPAAVTLDLI